MLETDERRMVAVLFADLVDSTGLGQRLDAERAREVLGAFFDAATEEIVSLRGQPEKFIGDAVMAVFGLRQTGEDDALRAIRAGEAIVDRSRRLSEQLDLPMALDVRVGIEAGDVATGLGPSGQLLVTGPAVNVAARLQAAAEPGQVLVGATAHTLTRMSVTFGEPRDVPAKGFDVDLVGYPLESLTTRSVRRTIPLVGRASELALLRETYARTVSVGRQHLFTLVGEPGIGKTRLVEELIAGLDPGVTALVGRVQAHDWGADFAPVSEMLRKLLEVDEEDPPQVVRARLEEVVDGCCDPTEVERTSARLALALDLDDHERDESTFLQEVASGFVHLVEALAHKGPVVLVFDDIHQAGPSELDLIERLAARTRSGVGPVLIVAAGRPEFLDFRPTWGNAATNHTLVRLDPLSHQDSVELARRAGGGRVRDTTAGRIAARAGGNPFFIVETTGMLLHQEQTIQMQLGGPLPPTVQAVVSARLDHLPPTLRDLARKVSVFIYSFDLSELALVSDADEQALRDLEEEEILVREERPRLRWRYRHEVLRDVAYASLPKRERLRLHLAIADALLKQSRRPSWAADHLERAALASLDLDPSDRTIADRAAEALAEAGDIARRRMEGSAAVDHYERALAMAGPEDTWGSREARILAGVGEARYWLGDFAEAAEVLDRAVALAERSNDPWAISLALRFRADIVLNVDRDPDRAERLFARALEAAAESGDTRALTRTLLFSGWTAFNRDDFVRAEEVWQRALDMARADHDRWAETRALTSLSVAISDQGREEEAAVLAKEALAVATELGDEFSVAVASVQVGRMLRSLGQAADALPHLERGIAIFEERGARWELADALRERGIALREIGQLDDAERYLQASLRISEEMGERSLLPWTWSALAKVSLKRGDRAAAEERMRRAEEELGRRLN
jgi:class 3 adenylate cyclase/tetratricopeptide (TPR) repeat protein